MANADLALASGLRADRGILVTDDLASVDDRRVFAIGDCAQPPERQRPHVARGAGTVPAACRRPVRHRWSGSTPPAAAATCPRARRGTTPRARASGAEPRRAPRPATAAGNDVVA